MVRQTVTVAILLLATLMVLAPLTAFDSYAEEGWNDGSISIHANPGDEVTMDGYPVRTVSPGSSVSFDLWVENGAEVTQTAVLWPHKPENWHCVLTGSLVLEPGASGKAMLVVDVPNTKDIDPDGSYSIRVEAVGNATGDRAFIMVILNVRGNVDHTFLLYPSNTQEGQFQVYPGERTFMDLLLRNIGNIADTYTLSIQEHRTDWDIQFREGPDDLTIDLSPTEFENILMTRLEIAVPPQAVPGESLDLSIVCTSDLATEHMTGRPFSTLSIHIQVVHGASIELVPETYSMQLDAGDETGLRVAATHSGFIGCDFEPTASVLLDGTLQTGWALETVSDGDGSLEGGETEHFRVFIEAPSGSVGEHILRIGAQSQEATVRPVDVVLNVLPDARMAIDNVMGGPFTDLKEIEVAFDVINLGDHEQDAVIGVCDVPVGFTSEIEPPGPLSLGPGSSREHLLRLHPLEGARMDPFSIRITCHTVDPRGGGLLESASATYMVQFMDVPDITIVSLEVPDGQVSEGDRVLLNVTLRNSGPMDLMMIEVSIYEITFSLSRIEIGRNMTQVPVEGVRTISFLWTARPSAQSIRVEAVLPSGMQDSNPLDNARSEPIYVIPSKYGSDTVGRDGADGYVPAGAAVAAVVGVGTLVGLFIFLINTDLFRYPFFFTLYPLYSKLRPETLLSNRLRKRIYVYVQNNPGEHFRSILVKLNLTNGTLAHHLYTLEKEDLIRSEKDGLYRRFYPAGYHMVQSGARLSAIQQSILDCIVKRPGLSQKDIAQTLSLSNSTVNYNVKVLEEKKVIESKRVGKSTNLFPTKETNS